MSSAIVIILSVLLFSFLIFIHELGHFLAAKWSGVRVNEFAMFMGPAIFKKQKGETLYSIRCIPIGGYCAMEGEDGDSEDPRAFGSAAWWKRLIILVAGSFMNMVAGILIMLLIYLPTQEVVLPEIDRFESYSTLSGENGLQPGDRFVSIDGEKIYLQSDFSLILELNPGQVHDVVVERNGQHVKLNDFVMEKHTVLEDGVERQMFGIQFRVAEADLGMKLQVGWYNCLDAMRMVRLSLQMLFSGEAGMKDMSGPVGIVDQMVQVAGTSETANDALLNLLYFGAFIAINLAMMNMLPIPALDGGRVVALLITVAVERIIGKKLNPKYEAVVHGVGMVLLLALMAFILFKDVFMIFKR